MLEQQTSPRDCLSMLRVSKSQIQAYLICPRKFYFQYAMGAIPEFLPASLPFGSALHAAVASFYRVLKETRDEARTGIRYSEFEIEWEKAIVGQRIKGKTSIDSHLELGAAPLQRFYEDVQPRKIEAVEYPFVVPLSDPNTGEKLDVSLVGVIDLIESDDEGDLFIAELKTSSKRYAESQGESQLDGLIYAYA